MSGAQTRLRPAPGLVAVERRDPVAVLTLDRAQVHNALNRQLLDELDTAVAAAAADPAIRCVVITGAGEKAFSAGADLDELQDLTVAQATEVLARGQAVLRRIAGAPVPVIAAVNGHALGGGFELVLSCTFPVLSARATLALPETGLGLMPGYGGTQRLPRLVGRSAAAHLMLTGARMDAERAHQLGLTPLPPVPGTTADLVAAAVDVADTIAARGPLAVRAVLTALATDGPLEAGLSLETALAGALTGGTEAAEGIAAFRDRRAPLFADPTDATGVTHPHRAPAEEPR
ncbi:enoyl-CoA hydratase/isomerase family protein [Pseudonocardia sp. GCM10023141]|uniref:enoyl-CoA hydratase/isomerase family protein n=1 Tax=Pseudonocardia sp. GCM10023141 TaxID=3252653 RepID=UPI003615EFAC